MKILLIIFTILLALPNFCAINPNAEQPPYDGKELYDPALARLNSLHTLTVYIDSTARASNIAVTAAEYPLLIEQVLKKRFYHGYSRYTLADNWVAAVGEKIFGHALACTVYSDDILQYPYAACSQQAMVMMDLLKQKGIPCRHVAFEHHYALEAQINGQWYFFDPNMEPNMTLDNRSHHLWAANTDYLKQFYKERFSNQMLDYVFGNGLPASCGITNEATAPNAKLFHSITKPLSKWGWLLPFLLLVLYRRPYFSPFAKTAVANRQDNKYQWAKTGATSPSVDGNFATNR
jgi:hypothetical protein